MGKFYTGESVFDAAIRRLVKAYKEGHRVVYSFSGGKDSGVLIELGIIAARMTGNLPIEVTMRDDEIAFPGTFEYAERTARRLEINFHWLSFRQGQINIFNREEPFFWVFDPYLDPTDWVRQPPKDLIEWDVCNSPDLYSFVNPTRYPPPITGKLCSVVGIRAEESMTRHLAIQSANGPRSIATVDKGRRMFKLYPIYDWKTEDIWKAILDNHWDYNDSYDVMTKMGIPPRKQRLGLIAMSLNGIPNLQFASRAWPQWFDKVTDRLPGIHTVCNFGVKALMPVRHANETWERCYQRACIDTAPKWVAERAEYARERVLRVHARHSLGTLPEIAKCQTCNLSWKKFAEIMYTGDPFKVRLNWLPNLEANLFRPEDTRVWKESSRKAKVIVETN